MIAKRHILANALRVAAEEYAKIAAGMADGEGGPTAGEKSLADQFKRQAFAAIDLAIEIEQAATITLED